MAARVHEGPGGRRVTVSYSTLTRWRRRYEEGGFDALVPSPRQPAPRTPAEVLALAEALKREKPGRTAAQVRRVLQVTAGWAPSDRTLQRLFGRLELNRPAPGPEEEQRALGRFECTRPNQMWTGDTLHGPVIGGKKSYLFAFIDDHSRAVMGARWAHHDDVVRMAAAFRPALQARGVPRACYTEYVPRNIFGVLFPAALCAWRRGDAGGPSPAASWQAHNAISLLKGLPSTRPRRGRYPMLENYFVKPGTVERIRSSWIAPEI